MLIPMWQDGNNTLDSLVFTLRPGEVALVVATGFAKHRTRTTDTEFDSPQIACLHRIILEPNLTSGVVALEPCSCCDFAYEFNPRAELVVVYDEPVYVNGRVFGLSKCDNTQVLALPGTYYFHLNDTTAIGNAQIWIDVFKPGTLPLNLLSGFTGVCHA